MTSSSPDLTSPPFNRYPSWTLSKLRPSAITTIQSVHTWIETKCIPAQSIMKVQIAQNRWAMPPLMRQLRSEAKQLGLWNLFLPAEFPGSPGLTNLEYACCAELMGRVYWAAQTMNCHAPETGNIELLAKYCNDEQKEKWLVPLLNGEFASAYSMTEPDVASSDATNISIQIRREGDQYVINGRKLFGNAKWNPEVQLYILMGCTDPTNPDIRQRHSMLLVPSDTPGFLMRQNLSIMGYDCAPEGHGEYIYENVRVPISNVILGEGRAFEIAQGRLGPGRIHHCMRLLGQGELAYELALMRATDSRKQPRGKLIGEFDSNIERIAQMRLELDALRLLVFNAADTLDSRTLDGKSTKKGRYVIAQSKILVPSAVARIIDECMQLYGGQGLTQYTPLPEMWTYARFVRLADGPDAAHRHQVGRDQIKTAGDVLARHVKYYEIAQELKERFGLGDELADDCSWEYINLAGARAKL
ncbi:acyl-CoA dehydrogenase/oxidase [Aspergillus granulosus]|uniref:Acyl-CoA dehydrogenase/oxidase n=1 Tax=Aspergillus granulosus TaxID=176169 RepID=A0ABR4HQG7_9EURO